MLTVLHILGNEPYESVQRSVYDGAAFFMRHGVDVCFAYDPLSRLATETDYISALQRLGAKTYKLPYLPRKKNRAARRIEGAGGDARRSVGSGASGDTSGGGAGSGVSGDTSSSVGSGSVGSGASGDTSCGGLELAGMSALSAALTLREMCAEYHLDVVHTHEEAAYRLACNARFLGARMVHVFTAHAITGRNAPGNMRNRLLSGWCDDFVAIDGYTAGVLLDKLIKVKKIRRINNGIDLSVWGRDATQAKFGDSAADKEDWGGALSIGDGGGALGIGSGGGALGIDSGSDALGINGEGDAMGIDSGGGNVFTILFVADSDPIGDGAAYDSFADLVLRIMHDFDPWASEYRKLRYIVATNSALGLVYASELFNSLGLGGAVEIARLSGGADGGGHDGAAGLLDGADGGGHDEAAGLSDGADGGGHDSVDAWGVAGGTEPDGAAWTEKKIGNWTASEAKIKLRSFKYKNINKVNPNKAVKASSVDRLYSPEAEASRMALYSQAGLCVHYSENRFYPYPAAETAALGVPTLTNDKNIFADAKNEHDGQEWGALVDFNEPDELARRILGMVYDKRLRGHIASIEEDFIRSRYDMEDMIIGLYDTYVRGLRA